MNFEGILGWVSFSTGRKVSDPGKLVPEILLYFNTFEILLDQINSKINSVTQVIRSNFWNDFKEIFDFDNQPLNLKKSAALEIHID